MRNETPERIWAVEFSCGGKSWTANPKIGKYRKEMEYIHKGVSQAEKEAAVAEALREAVTICDEERHNLNALTSNPPQSAACVAARNRILALIPDQHKEKNDDG